MKAVILALVLGVFLNMSAAGGQVWPIGSVAAVVIMGVRIKTSMDRRFDELETRLKADSHENPETKED